MCAIIVFANKIRQLPRPILCYTFLFSLLFKTIWTILMVCCMDSLNALFLASGSKLSCMYCNSGKLRDHDFMSRVLMELHWLPVEKRIEYRLLLYTYKALHSWAPGYLGDLVVPYAPRRVLRSA